MPDRNIVVFSGLPFSGKSWLLKKILQQEEFKDADVVRLDEVFHRLYPGRADNHVTKSEHVYKNEELRNDILRLLILGKASIVTEAVMLTREVHQGAFVELTKKASEYIKAIEAEYAQRDGFSIPEIPSSVNLKVILCFANAKTIEQRASNRSEARKKDLAPVNTLKGTWNAYRQFEFPDKTTYMPLYIDTSDESDEAENVRMIEILTFIIDNALDPILNKMRRMAAIRSHAILLPEIKALQ
ncbi:MAG: AAA family ATPase [bacterium]|nr:AAA family ATPase [bacterium]